MTTKTESFLPGILGYYISFSYWSSLLLFLTFYFVLGLPLHDQFFITALTVMNYYFYYNTVGKTELLKKNAYMPSYFLAQTILLIGSSFTHQSMGALYLSLIPCAAGTYYFITRARLPRIDNLYKGINLFLIASSSYVVFSLYHQESLFSLTELICFTTFVFWTSGTVFYGIRITFKEHRSHLFKLLKRNKYKQSDDATDDNQEKFLFHDLINITHGISLFLENRINNGREITSSETQGLKNEVKLLETMIQNHFEFGHKNLEDSEQLITFEEAKVSLYHIIQNYLPADKVECHFIYQGFLSADSSRYQKEMAIVNLTSFSRIMGNIVKNMSEVNTTQAEFIFNYDLRGLHVITKNKIYKLKDQRAHLAEKMRELILHDEKIKTQKGKGIGLQSIQSQVKSFGGMFRFKIDNGYWISELFIPRITKVEETRSAA